MSLMRPIVLLGFIILISLNEFWLAHSVLKTALRRFYRGIDFIVEFLLGCRPVYS
jgi:hypothetical protein